MRENKVLSDFQAFQVIVHTNSIMTINKCRSSEEKATSDDHAIDCTEITTTKKDYSLLSGLYYCDLSSLLQGFNLTVYKSKISNIAMDSGTACCKHCWSVR